jgi:ketosteroid isomerase-like protein
MLYHVGVSSGIEAAVIAANRAFYLAFAERDAEAMAQIWAREHVVLCIHPGRGALHGRDAVMASWRAILDGAEAPAIEITDAEVAVWGEAALVTCIEHIGESKVAATNVFVLERGAWRLAHHHAGLIAPFAGARRPPKSALN